MITFLIEVSVENHGSLTLLCNCMGWDWKILQNSKDKIITIQNKTDMLALFEKLNGSIYTIKEEKK